MPEPERPASPPPKAKAVILKCVEYIAKNGKSFEAKLKANDSSQQFGFLSESHPHHQYYTYTLQARDQGSAKQVPKPRDLLFNTEAPPIPNYDLEVIKATALYTAANSERHTQAFQKYMDKKGRRYQFAFLKASHTLHGLYQKYVAQYTAILSGTTTIESPDSLFARAYLRAAYEKHAKVTQQTKSQELKNRQLHFASIDWQDLTFVAKVSFDAVDEVSELPVALLRDDVVYRLLGAKAKLLELVTEKPAVAVPTESPPAPPKLPGMKIKAAGETRLRRKATKEATITCPITGQQIPESQFDVHLKTLLRDPRYKTEQDNYIKKNFKYGSNLTTDQVFENIKRLLRKRGLEDDGGSQKRITEPSS